MQSNRKPRVLVGCSGSVATLKIPEILVRFSDFADVRCICSSKAAMHFIERSKSYNGKQYENFEKIGGNALFITDYDEWSSWNKIGDPVLHIELRKWADILVVAPASADLLAKASNGIADNLLLCVLRAWDFEKPIVVAPAMNTMMWDHPVTQQSIQRLESWGFSVIKPVEKLLACKETGNGALASIDEIVAAVTEILSKSSLKDNAASSKFSEFIKPGSINFFRIVMNNGSRLLPIYAGYFCTFGLGVLVGLTFTLVTQGRLSNDRRIPV